MGREGIIEEAGVEVQEIEAECGRTLGRLALFQGPRAVRFGAHGRRLTYRMAQEP